MAGGEADAARPAARRRSPSAHALQREQEIYSAAAEIFRRKGYAATTLQDIADAVGIIKASLYYYIDSKEDLLYYIARTIHGAALANVEAAAEAGPSPIDRLRALIVGHLTAVDGDRRMWIQVFYTEHGHLTGARRNEIMAIRRQYESYALELVQEGQRDGVFCRELDAGAVGRAVLTMVNGAFVWHKPDRDAPLAEVARSVADLVVRGLSCPPDHDSENVAPPAGDRATTRRRRAATATGRGRG